MNMKKSDLVSILSFAAPVSLELVSYVLFGVVDQIFVAYIGENQLAAVGLTNQIFFSFDLTLGSIGLVMSSVISRHFGSGQKNEFVADCLRYLITTLFLGLLVSSLFFWVARPIMHMMGATGALLTAGTSFLRLVAFSFVFLYMSEVANKVMRSMGDSKTPMIITFLALGLNTALNAIVVFGPHYITAYGITGIAAATVVARTTNFVLIILILFRKPIFKCRSVQFFSLLNRKVFKSMFRDILPAVGGEGLRNACLVMFMALAARVGTAELVAYQIVFNIDMMFSVISYGFCVAGLVMVGHEIGRKDIDGAQKKAKKILKYAFRVACITGLLTIGVNLFTRSLYPNVSDRALHFLNIGLIVYGVFQPFRVLGTVYRNGILRGGGDHDFLLQAEIVSSATGLTIAVLMAMYLDFGIYGVYSGVMAAAVIKYVLYSMRFRRMKWIQGNIGVAS